MTAQMLLRKEEAALRTSLSERLTDDGSTEDWNKRLAMVGHTGITEEHLSRWVWILQGETADERVQRFLSENTYKPMFLLFIMVDKEHSILDRQLFVSLLDYIDKTHCQSAPQAGERKPRHRSLDPRLNMTPVHFAKLLDRLVDQALRLCPETLVTIAKLTTSYLKAIPTAVSSGARHDKGYTQQCLLFTQALKAFSRTSYLRPFANIKYNWEAQRHLLAFSTGLKRPFIINKAGYHAIQSVMVARDKSDDEEKVAMRSAKSWPPYREAWDGVDEQRQPEDDLSRAVKTGILAREAGYPDTELDRALGALGGAVLGDGPTIQTKSQPPKMLGGARAAENVYMSWAARVRATRNAQEAWALFRRPPQEGVRPSAAVYAEMFDKLLADEVAHPESAVPGSIKENLPVYQPGNLSEFEKWRLQPPTVARLYEDMLRQGVKPVGRVLRLLVQGADSEEEVLRYLQDSPYQRFARAARDRDALCPPNQADFFDVETVYRSIPLTVFGAYISFLCKMQRKAYNAAIRSPEHAAARVDNSYLQRALAVVSVRLRPEVSEGRTYKPPWYAILRTLVLARTHGALVTVARRQLGLFLDVFKWVRTHAGMDAVLLEIMCLSVGRVMAANFTMAKHGPNRERWWAKADHVVGEDERKLLARAWVDVMAAFEDMKKPASGLAGFHFYSYVRVLGMYGAVEEMVVVARWVLAKLEQGSAFEGGNEDGTSSHAYLLRAFGFVEAYGRERGRQDDVTSIKARRRLLVEQGYPFALDEMSERDKEDVQLVIAIAEGWQRHVERDDDK
jgi:DNA (cytosine-5)-methyltransferase 1